MQSIHFEDRWTISFIPKLDLVEKSIMHVGRGIPSKVFGDDGISARGKDKKLMYGHPFVSCCSVPTQLRPEVV